MDKSVLITGATGALGPAVIRTFQMHGWQIRTMSRREPLAGSAAAVVRHFKGDICDEAAIAEAMEGVDVVVHMAALLHIVNPASDLKNEYTRVNVGGTSTVMRAAVKTGVQRVVFVSSIAVYGPTNGVADETTPPNPDTAYASSKVEAETEVLRYKRADGEPLAVVLRLAAVYGPTIKGNYDRLVTALARRRFVPVGRGKNRRTLVFEDDAAAAIRVAALHASAAGRVFNVTDDELHTVTDIISAVCQALGRRPSRWWVPVAVARSGARVADTAFRLLGRHSALSQTITKYLEDVGVSGRAIIRELGFIPQWDLQRGWDRAVAEMKRAGRL